MQQIGEVVEYHGRRGIFQIDLAQVLAGTPEKWLLPIEQMIDNARQVMTDGVLDGRSRVIA
jgi:hypothetical protein